MSSEKQPPQAYLILKDKDSEFHITVAELARRLGLAHPIETAILGMSRDGIEMHAKLEPQEAEYPGITVDASTGQAGEVYLGNFELPSEAYPHRISARLYAGCGKYETDEPIAIVTHEITDDARVIYRSQAHPYPGKPMRKLVYVDERSAKSVPWAEAGEDAMPEHMEDMR